MEDKHTYTRREIDRMLQEWSSRTSVLGAGIFLCLSLLDFACAPDHALRFLGYRIVVRLAPDPFSATSPLPLRPLKRAHLLRWAPRVNLRRTTRTPRFPLVARLAPGPF